MDIIGLLVDLIVGILRLLFGDSEKPANPNDFSIRPKSAPKGERGPYNYGNKPITPPKTLEEILEEVRRQAEMKRQQTAGRPAAPQQRLASAAPAPRPEPSRKAELAERTLEPTIKNTIAVREDRVVPGPGGAAMAKPVKKASPQTLVITQAETGLLAKLKTLEQLPVNAVSPRMPAEPMSPAAAAAELAATAARNRGEPAAAGIDLLAALRGTFAVGKRNAARQAIILNEVIGPPRATRPYRPRGYTH